MSARSDGDATTRLSVVSRSREIPPIAAGAFLTAEEPPRVQWTSPDGVELFGAGRAAAITATGPHRCTRLREQGRDLLTDIDYDGRPVARPRFLGGLAFRDDHDPSPPWTGFPSARFILPTVQLTRADRATYVTVTAVAETVSPEEVTTTLDTVVDRLASLPEMEASDEPPGIDTRTGTPNRSTWLDQVTDLVQRINTGDLQKVVLARALTAELSTPLDEAALVERLRHKYPDCYRFLIQPTESASFFGAPPERFVHLTDRSVTTEALAGSVERGESPDADAELAEKLLSSEKLQREQRLVVDAIVDQLEPLGTVSVGDQGVRRLSNIQHLQTPITVDLDTNTHVLDVVAALHPTPAVGGLPPDLALAAIRETEQFDRGWYAAPIGWFDAAGDGEFAVGIRSATRTNDTVTLYAGNGIVADSDPSTEWQELQQKYRPILDELE